MKISFLFATQPIELDVELVDNPGISHWAEHFKNGYSSRANLANYCKTFDYNPTKIQEYLDLCHHCVGQLKLFDYVYDGPMPETIAAIDRNFTNQLHRFFTHTQQSVNLVRWPNLSLEQHKKTKQDISELLQQLNDVVHLIELYLPPIPKIESESFTEIYLSDEPAYNNSGWWAMPDQHRQYHSAEHADVIFGPQVLGKTLMRSYLDGDNPNDWDTTGHYSNLGSLLIQIGPIYRKDIYNSKDFKNWLSKWGMIPENTYYDYPVGNIKNKDTLQTLIQQLKNQKDPVDVRYML